MLRLESPTTCSFTDFLQSVRQFELSLSKGKYRTLIKIKQSSIVKYIHIVAPYGALGRPGLLDHTDPRGVVLSYIHSRNFLVLFRPYFESTVDNLKNSVNVI